MKTFKYQLLIPLLVIGFGFGAKAQNTPVANWDSQKIKGTRFIPYAAYSGSPFLTDVWLSGKIEFANGEFADSLSLRYSSFKDEIVYYNPAISSQIVIDKASLKGFMMSDKKGQVRIFRKQHYDGLVKGDRFFEVLHDGHVDLLAYRKTNLVSVSPYHDKSDVLQNMAYVTSYQFYGYSPDKGYTNVRVNQRGLYAKFTKQDQKEIRKLLRKNHIRISDENSFVDAWKTVEAAGISVTF